MPLTLELLERIFDKHVRIWINAPLPKKEHMAIWLTGRKHLSYRKEPAEQADKANGCRITRWLHRWGSTDTFITQEIPSQKKKSIL